MRILEKKNYQSIIKIIEKNWELHNASLSCSKSVLKKKLLEVGWELLDYGAFRFVLASGGNKVVKIAPFYDKSDYVSGEIEVELYKEFKNKSDCKLCPIFAHSKDFSILEMERCLKLKPFEEASAVNIIDKWVNKNKLDIADTHPKNIMRRRYTKEFLLVDYEI